MDKENKAIKFLYLDLLERSFKYFAIIIGFLYFFGLIITNLHLGHFGITNISLLRIQYIIAGFDFILFFILPTLIIISPILVIKMISEDLVRENKFYKILGIFLIIFMTLLVTWSVFIIQFFLLIGQVNFSLMKLGILLPIYTQFSWLIILVIFNVWIITIIFLRINDIRRFLVDVIWIFCIFIFALIHYTKEIHPMVYSSFAGGKLISADVLISEAGISIVESLGMNLDNKGHLRNIEIIHENHSMIYLMPEKEEKEKIKSIALPKNIVVGIKFLTEEIKKKTKENKDSPN